MKTLIRIAAILFLTGTALAGKMEVITFSAVDDSVPTGIWYISDSLGTGRADFDTSSVYDASYWDHVSLQVKFRPQTVVASLDSGGVVVILQMSNDKLYWYPLDSMVVVDSLVAFDRMTDGSSNPWVQKYQYARFVVHHTTKSDSAGVTGTIKVFVKGLK